jgi:GAF domain-containing protein
MNRRERILARINVGGKDRKTSSYLCDAAAQIVGVSGAGVMLMSGDLAQGSLCTTNPVSELIEELQYTLGEGPCVDAYRQDRVVSEVDLANPNTPRWLAFTPQVLEKGVRAIFGFPLRQGVARLGALNLYRDQPGPLGDDQHADALVLSEVIAQWVLDAQAVAPAGTVAASLEEESDFHFVVQNAAGMVSVQLGISVTEAHLRLRAYAFRENLLVREIATDVVSRRLRFA